MKCLPKQLKRLFFFLWGICLYHVSAFPIEKDAVISLTHLFDPYADIENSFKSRVLLRIEDYSAAEKDRSAKEGIEIFKVNVYKI